jgi:chromatin segregation and condensation protein Rec8/ScpA/Scc1 (kleisin family)
MEQILAFILAFASKYPAVASVIFFMGTMRLFMKPIVTCVKEIVALTESKKDDEMVEKVEQSKAYKTIVFILDYILSVKPIK